ncbi:MAG TPA: NDP-sugar synthase [Egibacteraceae bacterium]|nr:NDP-sugar synthase [Egibacteraceae bacterium]
MRAVILAGGQGTRLRPLTDSRPKPLVPFMGEPFALGLLRRLADIGVTRADFLVGDDAAPFAPLHAAGERAGVEVAVRTEESPLDTAGAVRRLFAEGAGEQPVLVCNGDILTDLDYAGLVRAHGDSGADATLALTRVADTSSFGVVVCRADGRVERFVEKPPPGTLDADTVNAGTYVLAPDVFDAFPGDGPLSFEREVFPGLLEAGRTLLGVTSDAYWQDLGTPRRYLDGHRAVLDGRCDWPGDPLLERRGGEVAVHRDAKVDPSAKLGPGTVILAHCTIGAGARLTDSVLLEGALVGDRAMVRGSILCEVASVEPAAALDAMVLPQGASFG